MHILLSVIVAGLSTVTAFPTAYKVPATLAKLADENGCILPQGFIVTGYQMWTPAAGNSNPMLIDFQYEDGSTSTITPCHLNASSPNVAADGDTARWPCDNKLVSFIWQDRQLTLIEKACPFTTP